MEYKTLYFLKILFLSVSEGPEKPLCKASHIYICPHTHTHPYMMYIDMNLGYHPTTVNSKKHIENDLVSIRMKEKV